MDNAPFVSVHSPMTSHARVGRARSWVILLLGAVCASCARGSSTPTRQVPPSALRAEDARAPLPRSAALPMEAGTPLRPIATPEGAVGTPALPPFMQPTNTLRCPESFPRGYQFVGTRARDTQELFRTIWLDSLSRGDNVVAMGPDAPRAGEARCIAVGPHRDLNLANWCCREGAQR